MSMEKKAFPYFLRIFQSTSNLCIQDTFKSMHLSLGKEKSIFTLLFKPLSSLPCSYLHSTQRQILGGLCFPQLSQLVGLLSKTRHASEIKFKTKAHLVLPENNYRIHCQCKEHQKHILNPDSTKKQCREFRMRNHFIYTSH